MSLGLMVSGTRWAVVAVGMATLQRSVYASEVPTLAEAANLPNFEMTAWNGLVVPAGTYGLHTIPGATSWQLIVSKRTSGWGIPYPAGEDLGRTPMTVGKAASPAELLTFHIDDTPAGATLRLEWGTTSVSVPFSVN